MSETNADTSQVRALVADLVGNLGPTLVTALSGQTDASLPAQWVSENDPVPDEDTQVRLRYATDAWDIILTGGDHSNVARQWFIASNSGLGEMPVLALREGRGASVVAAAQRFAEDQFE